MVFHQNFDLVLKSKPNLMNWKGRQTTCRRFKSQITNLNSLEAKLPTAGLIHKSPI